MIETTDLSVRFDAGAALRHISLTVGKGERIGIVGESGSGKSMLGLALMGMLPEAARSAGTLAIEGQEMQDAEEVDWRALRARRIAMIFQEPMTSLNPLRRVGDTVTEPLRYHLGLSQAMARRRALELFEETGIQDPEDKMRQFPHELSGGQRQRVLIALALACGPELLIADEPTTALDAHVALRITDLLTQLSRDRGMALMFISHDLAAVARTTDRIAVMYGGEIVERGPTSRVLASPAHPYTKGLIAARPSPTPGQVRQRLPVIPGTVPGIADLPEGCRFAGRCPVELPECAHTIPAPVAQRPGHMAACHRLTSGVPS